MKGYLFYYILFFKGEHTISESLLGHQVAIVRNTQRPVSGHHEFWFHLANESIRCANASSSDAKKP